MSTPTITSGSTFRKVLPNKNFMTPNVIQYITVRDYEVELSSGNGVGGTPQFGVTVVNRVTLEHCRELCEVFDNIKSAKLYINELGLDTSKL